METEVNLAAGAEKSLGLRSPCGSAGKESACNTGDLSSIPGLGRSPGEGKGYPLQYPGLENSMNCIVPGVAKSRTRLSDLLHFTSLPERRGARPVHTTWRVSLCTLDLDMHAGKQGGPRGFSARETSSNGWWVEEMRGWQEENPLGGASGEDPQAWGAGQPTLGALGWDPAGSTWRSSHTRGPAGGRGCSQPRLHPDTPEKADLRSRVERPGSQVARGGEGLRHWLTEELQPCSEGPTPVPPRPQHSVHLPGLRPRTSFPRKAQTQMRPVLLRGLLPEVLQALLRVGGVFLSFGRPLIACRPPC